MTSSVERNRSANWSMYSTRSRLEGFLFSDGSIRVPFKVRTDASGKQLLSVQLTLLLQNVSEPGKTRYAKCIVDSGAVFTVFHASFAKRLGIDLSTSERATVVGIGGSRSLWLHDILLHLPGGSVAVRAGFQEDLPVAGLLGMEGFFEHFRITFDGAAMQCELERIFKS
jgi:Aspartyl protease